MKDNKDFRKPAVEEFFNFVYENENVSMTDVSLWKLNFYSELENEEMFNSKFFKDQDDRINKMFPGMPENAKNLIAMKAYKHRAKSKKEGGHDEEGHEKRIEELEIAVEQTEYQGFTTQEWWIA
jgi:hypothetical protein